MQTKKFPKTLTANSAAMYAVTGASTAFSLSFTDTQFSLTGNTSYTFSSLAFGPADTTRKLAAVLMTRGSVNTGFASSVTIGGVGATVVVSTGNTPEGGEVWVADVPTGTTGSVTVTLSTNLARMGLSLYSIINPSTAAPATATSRNNTPAFTITIPSGGGTLGGFFSATNAPIVLAPTPTGIVTDVNNNLIAAQYFASFHSSAGVLTGGTSITIATSSGGSAGTSIAAAFAAWGP